MYVMPSISVNFRPVSLHGHFSGLHKVQVESTMPVRHFEFTAQESHLTHTFDSSSHMHLPLNLEIDSF